MQRELTCIDLFCGAGGFSLGFENAGINIAAAVDFNDSATDTYSHNFPHVPVLTHDIRELTAEEICQFAGVSPDDVDVVIGGPPCKGFSTAGKMNPEDPRNSLAEDYLDIVEVLEPDVVVMENVVGILHVQEGLYRDWIVSALRDRLDHTISDHHELCAADYGIPQLRNRIFFFSTSFESELEPPDRTHRDPQEDNDGEKDPYLTIREAIDDLSFLDIGEEANHYQKEANSEYQAELKAGSETLENHLASNHGKDVQERFAALEPGQRMSDLPEEKRTSKAALWKFDPDRPSFTITTLPEDFVHYSKNRIPTVREVARIQSFPDWFKFKGPRTTGGPQRKDSCPQYSQVGNAVPPKMAEAIAKEVKLHLVIEEALN